MKDKGTTIALIATAVVGFGLGVLIGNPASRTGGGVADSGAGVRLCRPDARAGLRGRSGADQRRPPRGAGGVDLSH